MSLAQHVTQAEGFDYQGFTSLNPYSTSGDIRERETSGHYHQFAINEDQERRFMHFTPTGLASEESHIAAYKVTFIKRFAQVSTAVVACWLSAGIVFGFAALKPVLISEGIYSDLCGSDNVILISDSQNRHGITCVEQDLRLNLFFVVASVAANISCLLAGWALDRYGRRACWVAGCFSLIRWGGTFIFVPSFQLAYAFPKHSGIIVAMVTGSFDASTAVFLLYSLVYDATDGNISIKKFFLSYISVPVLILVAEFIYMPPHAYHTITELEWKIDKAKDNRWDIHESDEDIIVADDLSRVRSARADDRMATLNEIENIAGDAEHREGQMRKYQELQRNSGVWGVLHGAPAGKQMLSFWFILMLFLTTLQMLRMNYFIATIRAQYLYMLGSESRAEAINRMFDIALPVGGIASTPVIGLLLNSVSVSMVFCLLTILITAIGVFNCLPYVWSAYTTVILFVIFRPLYYSSISDYATKVFGFASFGRIYGTVVCVSGIFSLSQAGLDAVTRFALDGNPVPINIALTAAGAFFSATLAVFVAIEGRKFGAGVEAGLGAYNERERVPPNSGIEYGTF
ncbi:Protein FMP42 [Penicillium mononematosum]|uniref:Protein FMP42 n=1 Tax=Penicillium mononematosum TaxID=268346 RepID=UPI0025466D4B|nr:Protein FMP42 [Penicillium mononematosum]KAJ6186448.1 Protein FMP42 [Penicillium mononematosum]